MITLKLRTLFLCRKSLSDLSDMELDVTAAYHVAKNTKRISDELEAVEAGRLAIIKKYGNDEAQANKAFTEFLDKDVEIELIRIPLSAIPGKVRPKLLLDLEFMIDDEADQRTQ